MYIVFPGCFNPPTYTHFAIANYVSEYYKNSKIIFIPVSDKYSKWHLVPSLHRINMLKLVKNKNFIISDIETITKIQPKTIETLDKLNKKSIRLLIGSDNLLNLKTWYKYEKLIVKYKPIIVERGHDDAKKIIKTHYKNYAKHFDVIKGIIHSDDSSTFIRENIKKDFSCHYYLPDAIIKYIKAHHLYEQNNQSDTKILPRQQF